MVFTAKQVRDQLAALDAEALGGDTGHDSDNREMLKMLSGPEFQVFMMMCSMVNPHVVFHLGMLVGHRLSEAQFMQNAISDTGVSTQ